MLAQFALLNEKYHNEEWKGREKNVISVRKHAVVVFINSIIRPNTQFSMDEKVEEIEEQCDENAHFQCVDHFVSKCHALSLVHSPSLFSVFTRVPFVFALNISAIFTFYQRITSKLLSCCCCLSFGAVRIWTKQKH